MIRRFGFLLLFSSVVGVAQTPTTDLPKLNFDVVSIHLSNPDPRGFRVGGPNPPHSGTYAVTNVPALWLITTAYGVDTKRVSGAPDWAKSLTFDVTAKSDPSVDEILAKLSDEDGKLEKQRMIQALLAERFHLKAHLVMLPATIYTLVAEKGGAHLEESKPGPPAPPRPIQTCGSGAGGGCQFTLDQTSMATFSQRLAGVLGTAVEDKTGLTGNYDIRLKYRGILPEDVSEDPNAPPPLVNALQDQLGLKLVGAKGQLPGLVIDSIDKPSEN